MPPLADSQADFAAALRDPRHLAPADIRKPSGGAQTRRFDVYRNNVAVSLIEALLATFPAVARLVGDEFFRAAARIYIAEEPPRSPLLFRYGKTFPDFLETFPPAATVPYLGDVARLEWARLQAYHAADIAPVGIEALGALPPDTVGAARFEFHPSLGLIRSRYPVVSLWSRSTQRGSDIDVDMARGEDALIVRPALDVDTRILPDGGGAFLEHLIAGETLETAASGAADQHPDFDLSHHLAGLFQTGAVTAVIPA